MMRGVEKERKLVQTEKEIQRNPEDSKKEPKTKKNPRVYAKIALYQGTFRILLQSYDLLIIPVLDGNQRVSQVHHRTLKL